MKNVIIALLAGVVIGVLIAPVKGAETVQRIKDLGDDVSDKANNLYETSKNLVKEGKNKFRQSEEDVNRSVRSM